MNKPKEYKIIKGVPCDLCGGKKPVKSTSKLSTNYKYFVCKECYKKIK